MTDFNLDIILEDTNTDVLSPAIGDHRLIITKMEVVDFSKAADGRKAVKVTLTNPEEILGSRGVTLAPRACLVNHRLALQDSEEGLAKGVPSFKVGLARFTLAVFDDKRNFNAQVLSDAIGREVMCTFKASKNTEFGDTELSRFKAV